MQGKGQVYFDDKAPFSYVYFFRLVKESKNAAITTVWCGYSY